jgi:hypothetical protein
METRSRSRVSLLSRGCLAVQSMRLRPSRGPILLLLHERQILLRLHQQQRPIPAARWQRILPRLSRRIRYVSRTLQLPSLNPRSRRINLRQARTVSVARLVASHLLQQLHPRQRVSRLAEVLHVLRWPPILRQSSLFLRLEDIRSPWHDV